MMCSSKGKYAIIIIILLCYFSNLVGAYHKKKTEVVVSSSTTTRKPTGFPKQVKHSIDNASSGRLMTQVPPEFKELHDRSDKDVQACMTNCTFKGPKACSYYGEIYPNACTLHCMGVKEIYMEICHCHERCKKDDEEMSEITCNHRGEQVTKCEHDCYGFPLDQQPEDVCECMDRSWVASAGLVCSTDGRHHFYSVEHVFDCNSKIKRAKDSRKCQAEDNRLGVTRKIVTTTRKSLYRGDAFMDRPTRRSKPHHNN